MSQHPQHLHFFHLFFFPSLPPSHLVTPHPSCFTQTGYVLRTGGNSGRPSLFVPRVDVWRPRGGDGRRLNMFGYHKSEKSYPGYSVATNAVPPLTTRTRQLDTDTTTSSMDNEARSLQRHKGGGRVLVITYIQILYSVRGARDQKSIKAPVFVQHLGKRKTFAVDLDKSSRVGKRDGSRPCKGERKRGRGISARGWE